MVDRGNLMDFFIQTLDGIGYGRLSKTNRAYNWIKNNHALEGPCLNFLKQNITADNLVTVKEMNLFAELLNAGNFPSEMEIDETLAEYLTDAPIHLQNMHLPALHLETSQASKYCETLELEETILKRQCHKLENEIKILESQQETNSKKETAILTSATKMNTVYNNLSQEIQYKLSKVSQSFLALHNNNAVEGRNLFRMNFDTFRKINNTFRDSVDTAIRRQFNISKKCEGSQRMQNDNLSQAKALISVAQSLGQYEYQHLKLQCEENEWVELEDYIKNILKKFKFNEINCIHLKSLMDADMKSTYHIQKKIIRLAEVLEKFHKDYVVKKTLMAYRKQLEHQMKADCKFLKKISNICANFVDLITLQACLFHEEKENVDRVVAVCNLCRQTLKEHTRKHLTTVTNLKKMFEDQESRETSNRSSCFSMDSKISNSTLIVPNNYSLVVPDSSNSLNKIQNNVLSFISDYFSNYFIIQEQLHELHEIMFSGPVRQIFFCSDVHEDESLVKQRYDEFSNQYKSWRSQYYEVLEKTHVTSFDQLLKTLGLTFLTNPAALRNNIDQLKNTVLQNRSKYSKTLTVAPIDSSTFSQLEVKKGNISSTI